MENHPGTGRMRCSGANQRSSWLLLALLVGLMALVPLSPALAGDTPDPTSVTLAGSFQSELGCAGDWQPDCTATALAYEGADGVWQASFDLPAGSWEYKAALNGTWAENYGANAQRDGANLSLTLGSAASVKFYYDHQTHWITDNQNAVIATVPGSYQSEIGCPGDWQPDCLRSWLQDPDDDGVYHFTAVGIPAGDYEAKVAINEDWAENYGQGGTQDGANIPFSVPLDGAPVVFGYDAASHVLSIDVQTQGHAPDNNVEYFGLGHNSHDTLYRVPFGAVTPGTGVILRFRTYHDDVTGVRVRFWDLQAGRESFQDMERVASDVACYDAAQPNESCDFWQATVTPSQPNVLYYRFIVRDGTATAFYDDDFMQDGGWGEAKPGQEDDSYVITVYDPAFEPVDWLQDGVVYQIFPDRFRNGRSNNDADADEPRYGYPDNPLDQIAVDSWGELPEGYCRFYENPAEPCEEEPRGRDYTGGDLRGVQQKLNYLEALGVTVIYFNPLFEAASNHAYDTQDYYSIDHFFGSEQEFEQFVQQANQRGIRVILDGVFNHVSSDSAYFDRYHHFDEVGACESVDSPYRDWFFFQDVAPGEGACVGSDGTPNAATYTAWFGFDSLPVLDKNHAEVRDLVYGADDAVARYWLERGASGWRLDVMGDTSFPADFWPQFRDAVKATQGDAVIVGELWKKHETLPKVLGDQADTAMNYRFRNAILGFFGAVDDKGFPDDGQSNQPPSLFALKLTSVREDYPDAAYYTMLNLMGSHDTMRILWALTPGESNREDREFNADNLAQGKDLLRMAAVVQFSMPGAPTIYYGDEVGVTGDDDPDDRRTFPWSEDGPYGAGGDAELLSHYQRLAELREANPVFREGELSFLLTDDANRTLAYLMRTGDAAAVVALNRSQSEQTLSIDVSGRLPSSVVMRDALGTAGAVTAADGVLTLTLPPLGAAVLLPEAGQDLTAPAAPANLNASESGRQVVLSWDAVPDAALYRVHRSPVTGGGYVLLGETGEPSFTDADVRTGQTAYYVVTPVDAAGNEGAWSNEASALPHDAIGWANLQWPPTLTYTLQAGVPTESVYGQVWIDGVTNQPGRAPSLRAQLGFGAEGTDPASDVSWSWVEASFNVDVGNNDEFVARLLPAQTGTFDYVYRYTTTDGRDWLYADLSGPVPAGELPANPGKLTVNPPDDTTPPPVPTGLHVVSASPAAVELAWDAVEGDPSFYGYEVRRSDTSGGPYETLALVTDPVYSDTGVTEGATYYYVVRSVDQALNRSADSDEVSATASPRTVSVTFSVTVPEATPAGSTVYIAGTLNQLDSDLPDWDPGGVALTQDGPTLWSITLTGREGAAIEYKYTLGSWDYVEKGPACEELNNRRVVLAYGSDGTQIVNDAVANWRNVSPCGG